MKKLYKETLTEDEYNLVQNYRALSEDHLRQRSAAGKVADQVILMQRERGDYTQPQALTLPPIEKRGKVPKCITFSNVIFFPGCTPGLEWRMPNTQGTPVKRDC